MTADPQTLYIAWPSAKMMLFMKKDKRPVFQNKKYFNSLCEINSDNW